MPQQPKAVIEAKAENPGRLILTHPTDGERVLALAAMKPPELYGLAKELIARGVDVSLLETDVEAVPGGLAAEAALLELGFPTPYPAYEETIADGYEDSAA